jgi:hypothetical protein
LFSRGFHLKPYVSILCLVDLVRSICLLFANKILIVAQTKSYLSKNYEKCRICLFLQTIELQLASAISIQLNYQ